MVSNAYRFELFRQETSKAIIPLVTLSGPGMGTLRFAAALDDITSNGDLYKAFPFTLTLPFDDGETLPTLMLSIDNVDQTVIDNVRSATGDISVQVAIVMDSDLDTVEQQFSNLVLREINYSSMRINGKLYIDDLLNRKFPGDMYTPDEWPGLF